MFNGHMCNIEIYDIIYTCSIIIFQVGMNTGWYHE